MTRLNIPAGTRFGKLVVVREVEPYVSRCGKAYRKFLCRCDCGTEKEIRFNDLRSGATASCGCWHRQRASEGATTHGMRGIPEYRVWSSIIQRCTDPNGTDREYYGGRGITVCDRWRKFSNFIADMGRRPFPEAQIDRVNNDGPYTPENCRWTTRLENANNKRNNRRIEWREETRTLAEWARHLGIRASTLWDRLDKLGWSVERAFTTPVQVQKHSIPMAV